MKFSVIAKISQIFLGGGAPYSSVADTARVLKAPMTKGVTQDNYNGEMCQILTWYPILMILCQIKGKFYFLFGHNTWFNR